MSPISSGNNLVRDSQIDTYINVIFKYEISIHELHNDLIKSNGEDGVYEVWKSNKLLTSNTGLRFIISVDVKQFTPWYK